MTATRFGMRLKRLRTAHGMTQVALAKRAKVTQGFIAQLEGGLKKDPSLATLRRLAKALGVSVEELLVMPYIRRPGTMRKGVIVILPYKSDGGLWYTLTWYGLDGKTEPTDLKRTPFQEHVRARQRAVDNAKRAALELLLKQGVNEKDVSVHVTPEEC